MAVVVKNTFLDVPSHKFLELEKSFGSERRSQSVPHAWKPVSLSASKFKKRLQKRSLSVSSNCSTGSSFSFCSTVDSFNSEDVSPSYESLAGSSQAESPCTPVSRKTSFDFGFVSGYESSEDVKDASADDTPTAAGCNESKTNVAVPCAWTKLKSEAPAFKPGLATDTRMDAITYAVYLALVSSGKTHQVNVEKGIQGMSTTTITAQVKGGSDSFATCYDTVHMARQVLEEMTTCINTVALLSKRVQKEDTGYSLRSSVSCIPCGAEDRVCWDLFKKGSCPRRCKCHWYHPQESDIGRIKVIVKCGDSVQGTSSADPRPASTPVVRHKISLGELVQ